MSHMKCVKHNQRVIGLGKGPNLKFVHRNGRGDDCDSPTIDAGGGNLYSRNPWRKIGDKELDEIFFSALILGNMIPGEVKK